MAAEVLGFILVDSHPRGRYSYIGDVVGIDGEIGAVNSEQI